MDEGGGLRSKLGGKMKACLMRVVIIMRLRAENEDNAIKRS
jgi:hypothetical protein